MARRRFRPLVFLWKAFCYGVGTAVLAVAAVQLWFLAHLVYWSNFNPASTAFMERYLEKPGARARQEWVPYQRISDHLKRAVVAAEDAKFLDHEGFDWEAIQEARRKNEQRGKVVAGASTISQQLAKNLYLSSQRSFLRKGQEAALTIMLERTLTKRRILEIYLNVIEWGDGIYGAEAAAQRYFHKPASALSANEAAFLSAMIPNPRTVFNPQVNPRRVARRQRIILRGMPYIKLP